MLASAPTLGPILWQLPETFRYDADVLAEFLALLPRTTAEAAPAPCVTTTRCPTTGADAAEDDRPLRHALESRSPTFADPAATTCWAGTAWRSCSPTPPAVAEVDEAIGPSVYVRLHGDQELYASGYTDARAGRVGRAVPRVDRRRPGRLRLLRQRHEGVRAVRREAADRAAHLRLLKDQGSP